MTGFSRTNQAGNEQAGPTLSKRPMKTSGCEEASGATAKQGLLQRERDD